MVKLGAFHHLHLHTTASLFDGMITIDDLIEDAKLYGKKHIAITDHGNICNAVSLIKACDKNDMTPIVGVEAYLCDDRRVKGRRDIRHITLLAKNTEGFNNLVKLSSLSAMYFYYRPRIDIAALRKYGRGLICMTGCLNGASWFYRNKGTDGADHYIGALKEIFGQDLYIEVMPVDMPDQIEWNRFAFDYAFTTGIPLCATNDSHYAKASDKDVHDLCMMSQMRSRQSDDESASGYPPGFYLRNYFEMLTAFERSGSGEYPEFLVDQALKNTRNVVKLIEPYDIDDETKVPKFEIQEELNESQA